MIWNQRHSPGNGLDVIVLVYSYYTGALVPVSVPINMSTRRQTLPLVGKAWGGGSLIREKDLAMEEEREVPLALEQEAVGSSKAQEAQRLGLVNPNLTPELSEGLLATH